MTKPITDIRKKIEDEKLIIFGWITTVLGIPKNADPTKYNELTDKIHDLLKQEQLALLERLEKQKAEYLDCQEDPEKNWQECTCENAKAIPAKAIQQEKERLG